MRIAKTTASRVSGLTRRRKLIFFPTYLLFDASLFQMELGVSRVDDNSALRYFEDEQTDVMGWLSETSPPPGENPGRGITWLEALIVSDERPVRSQRTLIPSTS